jgi:hypothetical protein
MSSYGVFDVATGKLLLPFQTNDIRQVQIQAPLGSGRVVLDGDYSKGKWSLGSDGLPVENAAPDAVSIAHVKYVARKRLEVTDWKVTRHRDEVEAGEETSITQDEYEALQVERRAIRAASNAIEQMDPIPADFWQDHYWSAS